MLPTNDLSRFLAHRQSWGVDWRGAYFVGFALNDLAGQLSLILGSIICITDGVERPEIPEGRFVDARDAVGVAVPISEDRFPSVLAQLGRGELPPEISDEFGRPVVLPFWDPEKADGWYVDFRARYGPFPRIYAQRAANSELHKAFGMECIERSRAVLLSSHSRVAYDGLTDLAKQLPLEDRSPNFMNHSRPVFDIVAPLPVALLELKYDKVRRGYRVDVECGNSVDRSRGSISLVPGPRAQMTFAQAEEFKRRGDIVGLRAFFPAPRSDQGVKGTVIFADDILFEETIEPKSPFLGEMRRTGASKEEWERKLEKTFDHPAPLLSRALRRHMGRAAPAVLQRVREGIEFLEERPFYSIVASASVVEALLRVRIRRYGTTRVNRELLSRGGRRLSGPPGRLMLAEAIEVAQRLRMIAPLETHAAKLLKDARNFVHIEIGSRGHPRYSEAEAIEAFLAMLRLMSSLRRRRPRLTKLDAGSSKPQGSAAA